MITLIFNNDTEHAIEADNFNYTVTFNVENYSQRADNINFNITESSLPHLNLFENVNIESIKVLNAESEEVVTLTFNDNLYILGYNTSIYGTSSNSSVSMGHINRTVTE